MASTEDEPVDGFTVERISDGTVRMTLSNRYGVVDQFEFDLLDVRRIANAILLISERDSVRHEGPLTVKGSA